ncbi:MAG: C1 family peptidase [Candidatus Omnitrophota bacterium]|nr:C1 family peptidase [Candidatus Omnitrophota bacterium]
MAKNKKKYVFALGCRKDPEDLRDIPMEIVLPAVTFPREVDYSVAMTPVRDQGQEGTCVAFAAAVGVKEYEDNREYKKLIMLSPRFLYNLCKKFDGAPDEEGTYPRIAMKILLKYGTCPEACWPYYPFQHDLPKKGAARAAKRFRISAYARLQGLLEMKRSLAVNGPFLCGVRVFASWFKQGRVKNGIIPLPRKNERAIGGHAICVMGYDERQGLFKFKNSWGRKWAEKGYGYLPYEYMDKYCSDAWSATDLIENPNALVKAREAVIKQFA